MKTGEALDHWPAFPPLHVRKVRCGVGARVPFRVLHVTDSHLARIDARDNDLRKAELASRRAGSFPFAEHYGCEAVAYARGHGCRLIHTGDAYDFVSEANLEITGRMFASDDWIACVGNHEFSKYVGEAKEDEAYKADSADRVARAWPNDIAFSSNVICGVNFVSADNVYYNFADDFVDRMEAEAGKNLPIVLLCHVPPFAPGLFESVLAEHSGRCAYLCGVPEKLVAQYSQSDRIEQQSANAATIEAYEYLKALPLLKAILSGHIHRHWHERFSETAILYVGAAAYKGEVQEIEFS